MSRLVEIVEVGPRDGLQNEKVILSVEQKVEYIHRLEAAGARRVESVSFVNPKLVPQMAGAEEISAALPHVDGRSRIGLVMSKRGWDRCLEARCDEANVVVCASDTFGLKNQGADSEAQLNTLRDIVGRRAEAGGPPVTITIATAFGCPFEGEISEEKILRIVRAAAELKVDEIAMADTIGVGDPWTVRRRVALAKAAAPDIKLRMHFHDTRNTGIANAFAALEAGADVLDASCGGIGGCPFAPAATGNIGTEDLVYMLERGGFETSFDLSALIDTANWMAAILGKPPAASVSRAGGFPVPR